MSVHPAVVVTVFYYCPWVPEPTGGIKQIHRHVEALTRAGVDASVLVPNGRKPGWFDTSAPIASVPTPWSHTLRAGLRRRRPDELWWLRQARGPMVTLGNRSAAAARRRLGPDDVLVLPEYLGSRLVSCGFGARVVVFNQNAHYTFWGFEAGDRMDDFVYRAGAIGVLAVSDHIVEYLGHAFPGLPILLTPNGIDTELFRPGEPKKRQIAYMPRKLPLDITQVVQILNARGRLTGWTLQPIDNMKEQQVAQVMRESAFFLSSCQDEGFGLPPLEAAACGCIVVGYHGQAAREFMLPQYCYPVDQGDVLQFAVTLERLLDEYDRGPALLLQRAARHAQLVRERYSRQAEAEGVVRAWTKLLDGRAAAPATAATAPRRGTAVVETV